MRILTFFRTLRGKLILTYTAVTVLALLALEIIALVIFFVVSFGTNNDTNSYLSDVISVLPPQARVYLQPGSTNLAGLQTWLQATYDTGYASLPPQGVLDSPVARIVNGSPMYVISPEGIVLAAAPASAEALVGRRFSPPGDVNGSQDIIEHALQLEFQPTQVSAITPERNYLIAVPVQQSMGEGPLVAVILVTVKAPPPSIFQWWPVVIGIVLATGLMLLLAVAPFGALFGFIMSRGITRRLKTLGLAVDAWSEGDFSIQPQDSSKDEISLLGVRMRRMAESVQALLHTREELALLEERNRLARELHDTVKQETFSTLMQVRAAKNLLEQDSQAARAHLDEAEELIKASQKELGLIISELHPAALDGKGLASALNDHLVTWSQHSRIPADLKVEGEKSLPLDVEQALLRVAQEALSNVARHSRASAVTVSLVITGHQVILCINDNGVGFDPSACSNGFGLESMRERMAAIQGNLVIQAAPNGGSTITAIAPVESQE
jgi:signal transduction histidine kinase